MSIATLQGYDSGLQAYAAGPPEVPGVLTAKGGATKYCISAQDGTNYSHVVGPGGQEGPQPPTFGERPDLRRRLGRRLGLGREDFAVARLVRRARRFKATPETATGKTLEGSSTSAPSKLQPPAKVGGS